MNDAQFLSTLNTITRKHRIKLPYLSPNKTPTSDEVAVWASYLEFCMKEGLSLTDPRWKRVAVKPGKEHTIFSFEGEIDPTPDGDFRVGLQLLMGMLGQYEDKDV